MVLKVGSFSVKFTRVKGISETKQELTWDLKY